MRLIERVMVVLAVLLLAASPALAKDKAKGKGKGKEDEGIQMTGIEAFDDVFERVGEIDKRLTKAEAQLRDGKNSLNEALDLKKGTPLTDGLSELKNRAGNKLELALDGSVPKLQVSDAVPSNVQSAVDAVNDMTTSFGASVEELSGLVPEIDKLVKSSGKMPSKLKDEFTKDGASIIDTLFKLPKISKALTADVQITAGLPDRATSVTSRMTEVLGSVQSEFGGGRPAHGGGGGGAGGGKEPVGKAPAGGGDREPAGGGGGGAREGGGGGGGGGAGGGGRDGAGDRQGGGGKKPPTQR